MRAPWPSVHDIDMAGPDTAGTSQPCIDGETHDVSQDWRGMLADIRPTTKAGWLALGTAAAILPLWGVFASPSELALPTMFLGWTLLALAASDVRAFLLPNALTFGLGAGGLAVVLLYEPQALAPRLVAMAAGGALLVIAGLAYRAARGRDGLGLGDAKLLAASGAWVGLEGLPSVVLIGSVAGLGYGLLVARITRTSATTALVPFGAFLALGIWLTWLYGPVEITALWGASW